MYKVVYPEKKELKAYKGYGLPGYTKQPNRNKTRLKWAYEYANSFTNRGVLRSLIVNVCQGNQVLGILSEGVSDGLGVTTFLSNDDIAKNGHGIYRDNRGLYHKTATDYKGVAKVPKALSSEQQALTESLRYTYQTQDYREYCVFDLGIFSNTKSRIAAVGAISAVCRGLTIVDMCFIAPVAYSKELTDILMCNYFRNYPNKNESSLETEPYLQEVVRIMPDSLETVKNGLSTEFHIYNKLNATEGNLFPIRTVPDKTFNLLMCRSVRTYLFRLLDMPVYIGIDNICMPQVQAEMQKFGMSEMIINEIQKHNTMFW